MQALLDVDHLPAAVLVVDVAHSQLGQPEGKDGLKYSVEPAQVLIVDTRSFDFSQSLFPDIRPNAVQLVIGNDRQYTASWDPSGLTTLSPSTLKPFNNSAAFKGLMTGDRDHPRDRRGED